MADFRNIVNGGVYASGSSSPYDNSIQIGNQLWFTTQSGGTVGLGTISYYDLTSHAITAYASLDSTSGNTAQSSLTQIGNTLYFTTTRGGLGDTGTVSSVPLGQDNPVVTPLYSLGQSTPVTNPRNPGGSLYAVGNDLYYTTPNGGPGGGAYGNISRYNTATGVNTVVYNFTGTGAGNGRQPLEGFTNVGGKLYFTTFTGGSNVSATGGGYTNGSGTLSVFDPVAGTVTTAASMPAGNSLFPSHNVTQATNGMLYFTTVGNATLPGSIQSFNISTGVLSTVYALSAVNTSGIFPDGRFAYGSLAEFNNVLYFTTMAGGANARGTIGAFDLTTNTYTKLADLDTANLGTGPRGGFTIVNENGVTYLYLLTNAGGTYGNGTVLRLTPFAVPEPGTVALLLTAAGVGGLLWRRRRRVGIPASGGIVPIQTAPGRLLGDRRAFTLVELLVVATIIGVLLGVALPALSAVRERGQEATCVSNLRQIGVAYLNYTQDNNGYYPSVETIGNSSFRSADDPLGLPMLFTPYLGSDSDKDGKVRGSKVWLCPGGRPLLKACGNNYAWNRSKEITLKPAVTITDTNLILAWDNFTYTTPSVYNVPESTNGGPRTPDKQYQYKAHRSRTKVNYVYADGHVL